mmetsp:Transcript_37451/g.94513  ORF Transcript_37451/g.94513 Transcript_37451/m.94513 type:complete len:206 (+) Transcript_37451:822-1439(+)|eukprot:CAMPEP_0202862704 /NCGR_PEP_ID=MMETSP1391-20130828/3650_1 /ASSEMBLY_ACC=CAM_ASM_000867 /TAXON_ID=1034604 /ORGANISM="Chlamydomonas leiostraca, Strain SAG 11-49" /LENGTH=205 /DNA_ID=CAMNT_0049542279 /DNA_START=746 /DNA_END=1363 /DNA_ORIENTATION=+
MHGVGVARHGAGVLARVVDVLAVQQHQRASRALQRLELVQLVRGRRRVKRHTAFRGDHEAAREARLVHAWLRPQAAVVPRAVLQRPPQAHAGQRGRVHKGGVLVGHHLPADVRLLEDVHGLHGQRACIAQRAQQLRHARRAREGAEHGVHVVQRVPDLVDGQLLGLPQAARGRVKRLLLKEVGYVGRRVQKVLVCGLLLVLGAEH